MSLCTCCRFPLLIYFLYLFQSPFRAQAYCVFSPKIKINLSADCCFIGTFKTEVQLNKVTDSFDNKAYLYLQSSLNFIVFFILEEMTDSKN